MLFTMPKTKAMSEKLTDTMHTYHQQKSAQRPKTVAENWKMMHRTGW
jgi:hypothetical protein